jgi:hypothetical protein
MRIADGRLYVRQSCPSLGTCGMMPFMVVTHACLLDLKGIHVGVHQDRPSCLLCSSSADASAHGELDVRGARSMRAKRKSTRWKVCAVCASVAAVLFPCICASARRGSILGGCTDSVMPCCRWAFRGVRISIAIHSGLNWTVMRKTAPLTPASVSNASALPIYD